MGRQLYVQILTSLLPFLKTWALKTCLMSRNLADPQNLQITELISTKPVISDEFNSLGDIGWYSSVYFMAMSIPQLLFGKLNARYPIRWTYSTAMVCFMVGSAVCGAAPNSPAFIVGRALAGMGSSGLLVATLSLVPFLAPPTKTPILIGLFAATMGVGDACGPLLGGVFTQNVSWRWIVSP